nr:hypothetical protein [Allomuricauda sp.]
MNLIFWVLLVLLMKTDGAIIVPLDTILSYVLHIWNGVNLMLVGYLSYLSIRDIGKVKFKAKYYDLSFDRPEGKR